MLSKSYKLRILKTFYDNVSMKDAESRCPFGKNYGMPILNIEQKLECEELCGTWAELGDTRRGCPCHTLGKDIAMIQVHKILTKEGIIT